jgi:UDP-glucose 4-epimerase
VLVVGYGFIGSAVVRSLVAQRVAVTVLSRNPEIDVRGLEAQGTRLVVGHAADEAACTMALEGVSSVVYCAGTAVPSAIGAERMIPQVVVPLETMASRAAEAGVGRFLFLSSGGTVYGEPDVVPVPEDHPLRPTQPYAAAKVRSEELLQSLRSTTSMSTVALRCSNPYGEGQQAWKGQGIVATLLAGARSGSAVPLFGDGTSVRDYIHVTDVAEAIAHLLACDALPPAVNVGTGVGTELVDVVHMVEAVCGREIRLEHHPARAADLGRVVLDITLLRSLVPFEPIDLATGLASLTYDATLVSAPT